MDRDLLKLFATIVVSLWTVYLCHVDMPTFHGISSVWCSRDLTDNKMCKLRNIMYDGRSQSFNFYYGPESVIIGLKDKADFQTIQLSSINRHNLFYANIAMSELNSNFTCDRVINKGIVVSRFKPDNLMHAIHDDIIPLFTTLESICPNWDACVNDFQLFMLDDNGYNDYDQLYSVFSSKNVTYLKNSKQNVCFKEVYLGLNLQNTWYQYGFQEPRGSKNLSYFDSNNLQRFKRFILSHLSISPSIEQPHAVIFRRTLSRKLLNSEEVAYKVNDYFNISNVVVADVQKHNFMTLLSLIVNSDLIIGVHGAEMILTIFAQRDTTVLEIFPFGIDAHNISFLRPLGAMHPRHFHYISWTNKNKTNSIRHPENPPEWGGIAHLPKSQQNEIDALEKIETVFCCNDPAFLYFMFQDTLLQSDFFEFLTNVSKLERYTVHFNFDKWFFPGKIKFMSCTITNFGLSVRWQAPSNVHSSAVLFNVLVKIDGQSFEFLTPELKLNLKRINIKSADVWISALVGDITGVDTYRQCERSL